MEFLFNMFNHSTKGQGSLEDVIGIVGHQLRALGHQAVWDTGNDKFLTIDRGYNVVVEGFNDAIIKVLAGFHAQNARFICLATEEPTDKGFNHGTSKEMTERQYDFAKAAPYLDAIWHLVPGERVTKWYSQYAPTAFAELGYAPTLVRFNEISAQRANLRQSYLGLSAPEPRYDFGFYGTLSRRRMRLLKKLANLTGKSNAIRVVGDMSSPTARDQAMSEAKVILQIRKFEEMGLVSSSRCCTSLCLGRPVVAEPHELSHPWDEVVKFTKSESDFINTAMMARAVWKGMHTDQFAKFKEKFTPEFCIGNALRTTIIERQQ